MSEFRMPFLGADMEGGKMVEWLVQPGDPVHHGDVIAVVETEKGAIEIEAFEEGTLTDIVAPLGEYRGVGEVLAHIGGEAAPEPPTEPAATPAPAQPRHGRIRVSPAALRLAEKMSVDLSRVHGTGHGGAITIADVEGHAKDAAPEIEAGQAETKRPAGIDIPRMRTTIAASMAHSKREIPHYYVSAHIDVTPMMDWLARYNEEVPVPERILPVVPLIKAAALALRRVPALNGTYADDAFHESGEINVGIAIALRGGGLAAPAILDTDKLPIDELMVKLRDLSGRVRQGRMRGSELSRSSFTVSSVGEGVVESVVPIIYPPQVGILGLGSIAERPWVIDGEVCPRRLITATLAGDHRASDGRVGARFLDLFDKLLQEPDAL